MHAPGGILDKAWANGLSSRPVKNAVPWRLLVCVVTRCVVHCGFPWVFWGAWFFVEGFSQHLSGHTLHPQCTPETTIYTNMRSM